MLTPDTWTKSSFSGGGQGDACVEIANFGARVAIRDSKDRTRAALSLPADAFTTLIASLKVRAR
ncbi:DUF397 domain-containing protein [Streptomyces cinnabarinus]|uniref:DUF397 domain-containing protein n=1 Tax=Streptomyces cinnabarinus TaxID=67287 RepID=A0ABY7KH14_9ACTN|nr:DUF397 domain-containing protein [Streptomyces cinnabarinus]WAZ23834.1 DUF397 domain-containing protein [Streptomyces cinnabarinus]